MDRGLMTLLYKDRPREDLKNWRPMTLLNFNYKLLPKVLAERFKSVLGVIIPDEQSGIVPGGQIHGALLQLRDELQQEGDSGQKMAVLNLDWEKAYNRVSYQFLFTTLQRMGIPPTFTSWIRTVYTDVKWQSAGYLLRQWGGVCTNQGILWAMERPQFYRIPTKFQSEYGLQKESPATMSNHKKIQKAVRDRDRLSTVETIPDEDCQAIWNRIIHKDLCKDRRDQTSVG
ncbi:hypothetical protein Y1Q_0017481 [Alligator mississippiensis]|uniref:Reverse transcriptase domain-containing protein n=1 Tax=Alligator mississippiensis TaxID=8496 RepID=A0A151P240_ALLMI|nr:hypothetical protein Y1Q_0017481 [Alligator mississippiensis]